MEQVIGVLMILGYISYVFGKEDRLLRFSEGLKERFNQRRRTRQISHHEYIKQVVDNANEKYWTEKEIAADKERVKKNFL